MMHGSLLRLLGVGCALVLAGACANGDDPSNSGFSISGVNPTQVTSASASSTGAPTTGDEGTTATAMTTGDEGTTNPATTLTTTGVDPSTTTTGDVMTTMEESTGDPPMPPMKDPQPKAGLYEHCLEPDVCDAPAINTCLQLVDMAMNPTDGFCTKDCASVADCGVKPVSPAVQECLNIGPGQNVCALKCAGGVTDCPTGMVCVNVGLPNGNGMYCF